MKKALFIDRDGTILLEPDDYQVDTLEKLAFYPGVIRNLYYIRKNLNFEFVMVTNQDGLGTSSFPEKDFLPPQNKMLTILRNEGIEFDDMLVDKTMPHENAPTRKPGIGMLTKYMKGEYDLANSYVIGDRLTDVELAKNLGAQAILIGDASRKAELQKQGLEKYCTLITKDWAEIYSFLALQSRVAEVKRKTGETDITVSLNLDGTGKSNISTGLEFFNHMLDQIARHADIDLTISAKGDLKVDEHHTIEDTAIALGECVYKAFGNKLGIERYGFVLPMDDCLAQVAIDFGGRPWLVWDVNFKREKIGDVPTEMFLHFFKSFADAAKCNLNIKAEGDNEHHKAEAIFKALARAIKMAKKRDVFNYKLPSTKGVL